jgi:DNA-binding NtrC family response regulator
MIKSVLIIDDDPATRETLSTFLGTLNYAVHTAASAEEGLEVAAAQRPDLVLLDSHLPSADGTSVVDILLGNDGDFGVIMLTGRSGILSAISAVRNGAIDFIEKPVDFDLATIAIRRAVELVSLRREVALLRAAAVSRAGVTRQMPQFGLPQAASIDEGRPGSLAEAEHRAIADALRTTNGNKVRAAKLLGIARSTLLEKLKKSMAD